MALFRSLALCCSCLAIVVAIPTFEHFTNWESDMGSLIPGASFIQAIGRQDAGARSIRYLNVHNEGFPGNLTLREEDRRPEWFYIRQNQLYQVINSTAIYPVDVKNITGTEDFPLQLISAKKRQGNRYGSWRWQGSMLFYEEGKLSNGGLYYECTLEGHLSGVFTFLKGAKPPTNCSPLTLHGFNKLFVKEQQIPEYSL